MRLAFLDRMTFADLWFRPPKKEFKTRHERLLWHSMTYNKLDEMRKGTLIDKISGIFVLPYIIVLDLGGLRIFMAFMYMIMLLGFSGNIVFRITSIFKKCEASSPHINDFISKHRRVVQFMDGDFLYSSFGKTRKLHVG